METVDDADVRPLRRVEYDALGEMGFFEDDDVSVELLEGVIVARERQGHDHTTAQRFLLRTFIEALPADEAEVGACNPIAATDTSEPEPDVALFPPKIPGYRAGHPSSASLLVEVSDSSLRKDLVLKARIYAQAGVPEYWVVDLVHRCVVVHQELTAQGYARVTRHHDGVLHPLRHPRVAVELAPLLGEASSATT